MRTVNSLRALDSLTLDLSIFLDGSLEAFEADLDRIVDKASFESNNFFLDDASKIPIGSAPLNCTTPEVASSPDPLRVMGKREERGV